MGTAAAAGRAPVPDRAERGRRRRARSSSRPTWPPAPDCLAELFDPGDRRYRLSVPQLHQLRPSADDHHRRALRPRSGRRWPRSPMCAACRAEYEDPADRRFHAQPTACPACGPRLQAARRRGPTDRRPPTRSPASPRPCGEGKIGALKGLGGYHLACDARNAAAVAELRRRKHRDEKPFAVMVRGRSRPRRSCARSGRPSGRCCASPRRPIVLLRKRPRGRGRRGGRAAEPLARRDAAVHAAASPAAASGRRASRW